MIMGSFGSLPVTLLVPDVQFAPSKSISYPVTSTARESSIFFAFVDISNQMVIGQMIFVSVI